MSRKQFNLSAHDRRLVFEESAISQEVAHERGYRTVTSADELRDLGFSADEVFRAIVVRVSDNTHHMVTLWFEDPDDPWVLDPTGIIAAKLLRISQISGWIPIKVFSERMDYSVR